MSNAIAIARDLAASGLTREQADVIAEKIVMHSSESQATKVDVAELDSDFRTALAEFRTEVKSEFARIEGRFNTQTAMLAFNTLLLSAIVIELLFGKGGA